MSDTAESEINDLLETFLPELLPSALEEPISWRAEQIRRLIYELTEQPNELRQHASASRLARESAERRPSTPDDSNLTKSIQTPHSQPQSPQWAQQDIARIAEQVRDAHQP